MQGYDEGDCWATPAEGTIDILMCAAYNLLPH